MQKRDVLDRHTPNMDGAVSDSLDVVVPIKRWPSEEDLKQIIAKAIKRLESVDTLVLEETSSAVKSDH